MENIEMPKCEYGCGRKAKFQIGKNRKWCCSESYQKCPNIRIKNSKGSKGKVRSKETKLKISKSKKGIPCSEETKKKIGEGNKGKVLSEETKKKISRSTKGIPKSKEHKNKLREAIKGKTHSRETKLKISRSLKGKPYKPHSEETKKKISKQNRYSLKEWKKKYPLFIKIEEVKEDPLTGKLQAHCKNSKCKNSKEQGGWFTPTKSQLYHRVEAIISPKGYEEHNFYCCDECKKQCPLYGLRTDPLSTPKELPYTSEEYETFKQEVLKKDNYICHFCGEQKATIVHHTRPQKLEPFFVLDPDFGISVCEECHYFIHRSKEQGGECSTGKLANTICRG
jgi:hypothetical protein